MPRHAPFPEKVDARTLARYQRHPTMIIFREICVWGSRTVLRVSVRRYQTATYLFTKTSATRLATRAKQSLTFLREMHFLKYIFAILALKKVT